MKKFVVLYLAPTSAEQQMSSATPEQAKAGMEAWMKWAASAKAAIVDMGAPLGKASSLGEGAPEPRAVAGYSLMQAESAEAVRALLAAHPHLLQPGFSIEVHEALPLPGM